MQTKELINFKKERSFEEILSDTFGFVRQNYKALFKVILKTVGPVLLLTVLSYIIYNFVIFKGNISFSDEFEKTFEDITSTYALTFFFGVIFMLVITILFYALFFAAINYSIQSYIENEGEIRVDEISEKIKENWSSFFKMAFLGGLMVFVGMALCFIPGIYLSVPLSLAFSIMIFKNMSVSEAISYSFKLVKGNWWISFLVLLVIFIFYYIAVSLFQVPVLIYTLVRTMTVAQAETTFSLNDFYSWPYLILNALSSLVQFVLYGVIIISTVFVYFNLDEKLNKTGTLEAIDRLGDQF